MTNDLFCKNYQGYAHEQRGLAQGGLTVYKGEHSVAIMSITPTQPGHMLLIPEQHTISRVGLSPETLFDLAETEREAWNYLQKVFTNTVFFYELQIFYRNLRDSDAIVPGSPEKAAKALENMDFRNGPTGYNLGSNFGRSAGQRVMHYHEHLIPRFEHEDGLGVATGIELVLAQAEQKARE